MADVVLYYGNRVLAVVQYVCGEPVVVKPELQPHC